MGGIFPNETSIYIVDNNTGSGSLTDADKVVGEIENWDLSGGEADVESVPVIGGFVDKENPRSQFEVSFDVIVSNTATSTFDRYDAYKYGSGLTSATEGTNKAIFIVHNSNSITKVFAMNNCRAITWEPNMSADDMLRGTINFKFSPTTPLGAANLKTSSLEGSTIPSISWD